ncbi:uncharacterized protein K02A2.6-like [Myxocyprinus asiaticus]|uniref:uncharacterized protein K02A2.6-like n=1 Tax=Myxocyprinus asiaticus TaxID=70543 RepID=UPI0022224653|nr:uncharacterized protein K02A2.6-like [Myxocyprinus asiaticus]XP_051503421.1 uncharacterized protein K02A2.6-like [Myxocyprinus asiaticus]
MRKERERIRQFAYHHLADTEQTVVSSEAIKDICEHHQVCQQCDYPDPLYQPVTLVESLAVGMDALPQAFQQEDTCRSGEVSHLSEQDLRRRQRADPEIGVVIKQLDSKEKPCLSKLAPSELTLWFREWNRLELKNGVLFRKRQEQGSSLYQLELPADLCDMVMKELHDEMGHLGIERTLDLIRSKFFRPKMSLVVEQKVKTYEHCVRWKTPSSPLVNIKTSRTLELVCMDFLSLEPDRSNTKDILVITDHFTKYAVAEPTRNQKAQTIAKSLWDNFLVHYGFPENLHCDPGPDFESRTIKELCKVVGISKIRTTLYHPRGNPVERFNWTHLQMLGTLCTKEKSNWKDFVKPLVHAYNCTRNDVTGFLPYELMFGRQPDCQSIWLLGYQSTVNLNHTQRTCKTSKTDWRRATRSAKEPKEFEIQSEHSESDEDPIEYHTPIRTLEIETRIVSKTKPVTSLRIGRTVNLPGVEPVSEQVAEYLIQQEPVNDTNLPEPVERNLLDFPEVVGEDLEDESEREIEGENDQVESAGDHNKSAEN